MSNAVPFFIVVLLMMSLRYLLVLNRSCDHLMVKKSQNRVWMHSSLEWMQDIPINQPMGQHIGQSIGKFSINPVRVRIYGFTNNNLARDNLISDSDPNPDPRAGQQARQHVSQHVSHPGDETTSSHPGDETKSSQLKLLHFDYTFVTLSPFPIIHAEFSSISEAKKCIPSHLQYKIMGGE